MSNNLLLHFSKSEIDDLLVLEQHAMINLA